MRNFKVGDTVLLTTETGSSLQMDGNIGPCSGPCMGFLTTTKFWE